MLAFMAAFVLQLTDLGGMQGSVLEGVGRKLRGSDAARFRESVMRQTGFLEPQSLRHVPAD